MTMQSSIRKRATWNPQWKREFGVNAFNFIIASFFFSIKWSLWYTLFWSCVSAFATELLVDINMIKLEFHHHSRHLLKSFLHIEKSFLNCFLSSCFDRFPWKASKIIRKLFDNNNELYIKFCNYIAYANA